MPAKTWFITGASSGFGRAFAEHALAQGHNVAATARQVSTLDGFAATAPDRAMIVALDVTRPAEIDAAIAAVISRFGRIDVLVNNAGYGVVGAFEETSDIELRALMETNFFGPLRMSRAFAPTLAATSSTGSGDGAFGLGALSARTVTDHVALTAPIAVSVLLVGFGLALAGGLLAGGAGALRAARLRPAAFGQGCA